MLILVNFVLLIWPIDDQRTQNITNRVPKLDTSELYKNKVKKDTVIVAYEADQPQPVHPLVELYFLNGLVDVIELDSSIRVDLRYGGTNNVWKADMYDGMERAFLQKKVADKLVKAQSILKEKRPELSLLVLDATRPQHIQMKMWESLKGTDKQRYVSMPSKNAMHTYGAAVDVTLVDNNGLELDMGTPFDFFGKLAEPRHEQRLLNEKKLTKKQLENRYLLRTVMREGGFRTIPNEWWHFNAFRKTEVWDLYRPIK